MTKMRKQITMVFILLLSIFLVACSSESTGPAVSPISEVEQLIASIENVTLESEAKILAAENAYNDLTEDQKAQVTNYAELESARTQYNNLVELQPAQEFAAKLLTACAVAFKKPLALKVNNVWVWQDDILGRYYFTFSLDVTNDLGNTWTAYYGNSTLGFSELTDREISSAAFQFANGIGFSFEENGIKAMQNGTELDAEYVQNYLLMNFGK